MDMSKVMVLVLVVILITVHTISFLNNIHVITMSTELVQFLDNLDRLLDILRDQFELIELVAAIRNPTRQTDC